MAITIGQVVGSNPMVFPCKSGTSSFDIVVSNEAEQIVPTAQLNDYVTARVLLVSGQDPLPIVSPLASGNVAEDGTDTRNWAKLWIDGIIIS